MENNNAPYLLVTGTEAYPVICTHITKQEIIDRSIAFEATTCQSIRALMLKYAYVQV